MKGKYSYTMQLSIGLVGCDRSEDFTVGDMGYTEEEWDAISDEQRKSELDDYANETANQYIEISWE